MDWRLHDMDRRRGAHALRKTLIIRPQHHGIVPRGQPRMAGIRPVAETRAITEGPSVRRGVTCDLPAQVENKPNGKIRIGDLDGRAQSAGDRSGVVFVATYRRRIRPGFPVNILAARVGRAACATAQRTRAEM